MPSDPGSGSCLSLIIKMFRLRLSLSLFAIVCLPLAVPAQSIEPTDTLRIDTDLVNLNVSVFYLRASQGTQVLQPKDFAVLENGAAQEISFFASNEAKNEIRSEEHTSELQS